MKKFHGLEFPKSTLEQRKKIIEKVIICTHWPPSPLSDNYYFFFEIFPYSPILFQLVPKVQKDVARYHATSAQNIQPCWIFRAQICNFGTTHQNQFNQNCTWSIGAKEGEGELKGTPLTDEKISKWNITLFDHSPIKWKISLYFYYFIIYSIKGKVSKKVRNFSHF